MAKVSGPLFSVEASGQYAGALVFAKWKGTQYVRQLVKPSNPQTIGQETARNNVRTSGSAQKWVNGSTQINAGLTLTDKAEITAITPAGKAWNGYLVDNMIGKGGANMVASDAAYAALTGGEQTAWDTAADGLSTALLGVIQTVAGGGLGAPKPSGQVFFNYTYGLYVMGLSTIPDATPPVYV